MFNDFHSMVPAFTPFSVRVVDTFSNELTVIDTIDQLNDWLYEEKTHYFQSYRANAMATAFITLYNEFVASGNETAAMEHDDTRYYLIKN